MVKMVRTVEQGEFQESPYSRIFRVGVPSEVIELAPFGAAATPAIRKRFAVTRDELEEGSVPFQGPSKDQSGKIRVPAGRRLDCHEPENTDYLVPGVVGKIPGGA
jgi:basic membrane protein A and related proteins